MFRLVLGRWTAQIALFDLRSSITLLLVATHWASGHIGSMIELEASLASRLHEHEEQLKKHRLLVEKQREWLVDHNLPHQVPPSKGSIVTPTTTAVAATKRSLPIEERLLQKGEESRRRIEAEREKLEAERIDTENAAIQERAPTSSLVGRRSSEFSRTAWQPVENTSKPQISLMSERLAEARRARDGHSHLDIASSLLIRTPRNVEEQMPQTSQPSITPRASALHRPGTAFERLYASHSGKSAEPQSDLRALIEESLVSGTPIITARAQALQRREGHSVCDDLYADARRAREERIRKAATPPPRSKPKIDAVSEIIATQLPMSSAQRLILPRSAKASVERPTFTPTIAKASEKLVAARESDSSHHAPHHEHLHRESYRRASRIQEQSAAKLKAELEGCTFKPKISLLAANSRVEAAAYDRMSKWQQRRSQRVEDERIKRLEEEDRLCTFAPSINTSSAHDETESLVYGGDGRAWGFNDFVERQNAGRKKRSDEDEHVAQAFADGSNWRRASTIPKEPNISAFNTPSRPSQAHVALSLAMNALREAEAVTAMN